jgi:thiosulfate dehydrogenase [quinone] large subunit
MAGVESSEAGPSTGPSQEDTMSTTRNSPSVVTRNEALHPELAELAGERKAARVVGTTAAVTRVSIGFVFLWAFFDKLLGLGRATPAERAWTEGGSPTAGFLSGVEGPFGAFFQSMSGQAWADWLFMGGLLGIGLALTAGIAMRIAAASGALLLVFMWMASLPLENNPFMDDHLVYAMVLVLLAALRAGDVAGLGAKWRTLPVVRDHALLQ